MRYYKEKELEINYKFLIKGARYALNSHSRDLVLETYGMAKMALMLRAITTEQYNQLNEMLVVKGLNDPANCHLE